MNISVQKIVPFQVGYSEEMVQGIVSVYRQAFGGEPWNEGYVCPVCGDTFPLTRIDAWCPSCAARQESVLLVEYWPTSKVMSDFYHEMRRPEALCLVARNDDGKVVGFIWGYKIVVDEQIDGYLESPGLSRLIGGEFFYLDDAAVLPEYQRKGIGKNLIAHMLRMRLGKNILARTLDQSQMFRILTDFHGKTVLRISRNRVIMAISS